jgi:hypothetical protein
MRFTTENARTMGRRGGRACVAKHGVEHMQAIGRLGFLCLARSLGYAGGSRRAAVIHLQQLGRLKGPGPTLSAEELSALQQSLGLDEDV